MMSIKLCAIAATVYGLRSLEQTYRSTKPRMAKCIGKTVNPQMNSIDSNSILANYNRALVVESNLK